MDSMASIRTTLLVLLVCFFFSSVKGGRSFVHKEEDIDLEKQLKLLNKPSIKSIQTKHGDIYDCVDFYEQPAFDHPLLKHHKFHHQMRPSSIPQLMAEKEQKAKSSINASHSIFGHVDCPFGTVPIRRITKDDLIREKLYSEINNYKYGILNNENPGTHYAVVRTKFDPAKKYNGVGAEIIVYNPQVLPSQYSSARMKIQNGVENIQLGWTVNPSLYGDTHTRLYTAFNGAQSGCFNIRCPGFVIVNNGIPLDSILDTDYNPNNPFSIDSFIFKDASTSNWWLAISNERILVGFWPPSLFTKLADLGSTLEWGGEVFSPTDVPSPPMGKGSPPSTFRIDNSYIQLLTTVDEANNSVDVVDTEEYNDVDNYGVIDIEHSNKLTGHGMYYGGSG